MFADVRTYWSGEAIKRVTGYEIEGRAKDCDGVIHLINSGACCLDATGEARDENGQAVMKQWWDTTEEDQKSILRQDDLQLRRPGLFPRRRILRPLHHACRNARHDDSPQPRQGSGAGAADRRRLDDPPAGRGFRYALQAYRLHLAVHLVLPRAATVRKAAPSRPRTT